MHPHPNSAAYAEILWRREYECTPPPPAHAYRTLAERVRDPHAQDALARFVAAVYAGHARYIGPERIAALADAVARDDVTTANIIRHEHREARLRAYRDEAPERAAKQAERAARRAARADEEAA